MKKLVRMPSRTSAATSPGADTSAVNQTRTLGGDSEKRTTERRERGDLGKPPGSPDELERAAFPQYWPFPANPFRRAVNQKDREFVVGLFGSPLSGVRTRLRRALAKCHRARVVYCICVAFTLRSRQNDADFQWGS